MVLKKSNENNQPFIETFIHYLENIDFTIEAYKLVDTDLDLSMLLIIL